MSATKSSSSSTRHLVFCPPPQGKPNPLENKPQGTDTRTRIARNAMKSDTCWQDCFDLLRDRIKAPNTSGSPDRLFEKLASKKRKDHIAADKTIPTVARSLELKQAPPLAVYSFKNFKRADVEHKDGKAFIASVDAMNFEVKVAPVLPSFAAQNKFSTLHDFLIDLSETSRLEPSMQFLSEVGIDPKQAMQQLVKERPDVHKHLFQGKDWDQLSNDERGFFLDMSSRKVMAERFGFKVSPWTRTRSFNFLFEVLGKCGPMIVGGQFGYSFYQNPPESLKRSIEGREIFSWPKGAPRKTMPMMHEVVIVGAEKRGENELVYFIDPNDMSDPLHPEKQKILTMSYQRLTEKGSISDICGFLCEESPYGFAYYFDKSPHNSPSDSSKLSLASLKIEDKTNSNNKN